MAEQALDEPSVLLLLSVINSKDLWGPGAEHNMIFPKNSPSAFAFIER